MTNTKVLTNAELAEAIEATHYCLRRMSASASDKDKELTRQHLASLLAAQASRAHGDGPGEEVAGQAAGWRRPTKPIEVGEEVYRSDRRALLKTSPVYALEEIRWEREWEFSYRINGIWWKYVCRASDGAVFSPGGELVRAGEE